MWGGSRLLVAPQLLVLALLWCATVADGGQAEAASRNSALPKFSVSEEEYQKNAWEGLIACSIARHFVATLFDGAGLPASSTQLLGAAGAAAGAGDGVNAGKGAKQTVTRDRFEEYCSRYKGIFLEECMRGGTKIAEKLKKWGKSKASQAKLLEAIVKTGVCGDKAATQGGAGPASGKASSGPASGAESALAAGGLPCWKGEGHCDVHTKVRDLVVEGNLTVRPYHETYPGVSIPPIVHFIFGMTPDFGGKPFSLVHYLSVKSALDVMPGATVFLYYKYLPSGEWGRKALALPGVQAIRVKPVTQVRGREMVHMAHVADLLRLQALRDMGGIYMDLDVITLRPFTPLMQEHSFVMGQEGPRGVYGLCNAVMLSAPGAGFVKLWLQHFGEAFDPAIWSMHSVKLPSILGHLYPHHLTQVHDRAFFYPLWDKIDHMFAGHGDTFPENFAMHLWESLSWDKYINRLSEEYILNVDNNFNNAVRRFLA